MLSFFKKLLDCLTCSCLPQTCRSTCCERETSHNPDTNSSHDVKSAVHVEFSNPNNVDWTWRWSCWKICLCSFEKKNTYRPILTEESSSLSKRPE